jgi:hypothetical protein
MGTGGPARGAFPRVRAARPTGPGAAAAARRRGTGTAPERGGGSQAVGAPHNPLLKIAYGAAGAPGGNHFNARARAALPGRRRRVRRTEPQTRARKNWHNRVASRLSHSLILPCRSTGAGPAALLRLGKHFGFGGISWASHRCPPCAAPSSATRPARRGRTVGAGSPLVASIRRALLGLTSIGCNPIRICLGGYKLRPGRLRIGSEPLDSLPPHLTNRWPSAEAGGAKDHGGVLPRNHGKRQRLSGSLWAP